MRSGSSTCSSTHGWPDPDLFTSGVSCAPSSHLSLDQVSGPPAWPPSPPPAAPPMNMEVKGSYLHIPDQSARPGRSCGGSGGAPAPVCCRSCRSRGFHPPRGHTSSASSSSAPTLHTGVVTWSAGRRKTVVRIKLFKVCVRTFDRIKEQLHRWTPSGGQSRLGERLLRLRRHYLKPDSGSLEADVPPEAEPGEPGVGWHQDARERLTRLKTLAWKPSGRWFQRRQSVPDEDRSWVQVSTLPVKPPPPPQSGPWF